LPHVYSSLRAVLARGLIPKRGQKEEERRRIKVLRVAFFLPLFFSGLRRTEGSKASPQAQYTLALLAMYMAYYVVY